MPVPSTCVTTPLVLQSSQTLDGKVINSGAHILRFVRSLFLSVCPLRFTTFSLFWYLICCGQLLAIGGKRDEAGGQVDQTANLQVGVGAVG